MSTVHLATTEAETTAARAIESHHAEMVQALAARVAALRDAAAAADEEDVATARGALVAWCRGELLPHAQGEEATLYPATSRHEPARLLVSAMTEEHRTIGDLVDRVASAPRPVDAVGAATALQVLFEGHAARENDLLLPVLAGSRQVSLAELLEQMHTAVGAASPVPADQASQDRGHCGCH